MSDVDVHRDARPDQAVRHPPRVGGRGRWTVARRRTRRARRSRVHEGEIFGFLGPNGAGKSTTIRLLLGFLHPTRGPASVLGRDIVRDCVEIRRRVGYLPGGIAFCDNLTGERLLDYLGDLTGRPPVRRAELLRAPRAVRRDPPPTGPRLLARDAPEDRDRPGAPARSRAGDPRRADRRPRPAHAAGVLRDPRRAARRQAGRSSSRRTSCPRSSGSAIGWRSSAAAGSSRSRTSTPCWPAASATSSCGSRATAPALEGVAGRHRRSPARPTAG